MKTVVSLIAKLSRIELAQARRAWLSAGEADSVQDIIPQEFATGRQARAYALAFVLRHHPLQCALGSFGLFLFAGYLIGRLALHVNV
jgi:hypothetical protein